jgi:type II secretory pathway component PulC
LPLKLVGILAETKAPAPRFAIIESTGSAPSQAIYQVGDRVQQVVIVDILPGCVVLNRDGAQQQLCLEEVTETAPPPDAALHIVDILPGCVVLNRDGAQQQLCFEEITETAPAPDAALRAAAAPVPSPAPQPDDVRGADTVRIDAETWQIRRETLLEQFANVGSLSTQATVTPYFVQGQQRGFRLSQIRAGGIFQHMGLQEGDVLQQVNGLAMHTPQEALQAYQQLHTASTVRLSILRNNSATTLTYDIR